MRLAPPPADRCNFPMLAYGLQHRPLEPLDLAQLSADKVGNDTEVGLKQTAQEGAKTRADLGDRPLAVARAAATDRNGAGDDLDQRHV